MYKTIHKRRNKINKTMSRRRALLAASQMGGGKIVNHGVITTSRSFFTLTFEYPVATDYFEVSCGDAEFVLFVGETESSWAIGPGESLGSTVSFYPSNEDDTYIYEVTIEQ